MDKGILRNSKTTPVSRNNRMENFRPKSTVPFFCLQNAEILEEWVGLRPCRSALRVDRERKLLGAEWKPMWIVNNYGQGPLGVAVSWGCAVSACELVQEILTADSRSKL